MENVVKRIFNCGIVPVIKLTDASNALPLAQALLNGGIDVAEVTFRTNAAEEAIKRMSEMPDVFVGAGTVTDTETAKKAAAAGAKFIVSPGFNPRVVEYCLENNLPIIPGISSPTDIETALNYGLKYLKFFPAEASGGLKKLKAMSAPYGGIRFMPTGGIDASNLTEYLMFDKVIACGGSWMVSDDLLAKSAFDEITKLTKDAVAKMHGFSLAHVGINPADDTAKGIADMFTRVFGFSQRTTSKSIFSTESIEIMNMTGMGGHGHLGIRTNNVARAIAHLEKMGVEFDYDTINQVGGVPIFVYLKQSYGQFKVHLVNA